jgi:hypothetical protein
MADRGGGGRCFHRKTCSYRGNTQISPLAPELNSSAQSCLPRFFTGILIFKGLAARRLYKSFDVKGLRAWVLFFYFYPHLYSIDSLASHSTVGNLSCFSYNVRNFSLLFDYWHSQGVNESLGQVNSASAYSESLGFNFRSRDWLP